MDLQSVLLLLLIVLLYFIRKNTLLNVILLAASIPFETYINWKVGFTFKPAQLFALSTFISLILNKEELLPALRSHIPFLLLLFAALISLVNAPREILFGGYHGSIRMIFNLGLLYFIAYVISISVKDAKSMKGVMFAYAAALFFSVIIETIRAHVNGWEDIGNTGFSDMFLRRGGYAFLPSITYEPGYLRLSPINMPANHYGAMLMVGLIFLTTLGVYVQTRLRNALDYLLPALFSVCLFGFLLTFSRGSWISYLIALAIILISLKGRDWYRIAVYGGVSLIATSILLLNIYPGNLYAFLERAAPKPILNAIFSTNMPEAGHNADVDLRAPTIKDAIESYQAQNAYNIDNTAMRISNAAFTIKRLETNPDGSAAIRVSAIKEAFEAFKAHPIIGSGWATNFKPHNVFLQILCESGLIGLAAFLGFFAYIFYNLYKTIRSTEGELKSLAIGITAGLAGLMFYFNTDTVLYEIQVWLFIGMSMLIIRLAGQETQRQAQTER